MDLFLYSTVPVCQSALKHMQHSPIHTHTHSHTDSRGFHARSGVMLIRSDTAPSIYISMLSHSRMHSHTDRTAIGSTLLFSISPPRTLPTHSRSPSCRKLNLHPNFSSAFVAPPSNRLVSTS